MSWIYLSHTLSESTPLYNDDGSIQIQKLRKMSDGDSCNSSQLSMPVHSGTHIDAPYHFDQNGKTLDQYPADFWIASKPIMIEVIAKPRCLLTYNLVKDHLVKIPADSDMLLIRTGAEFWRNNGTDDYSKKGVGLDLDLADWIRVNLDLKIIGFDFISLSSPLHRATGRLSHQALLSEHPSGKEPVLILEDLSLKGLKISPKNVLTIPLRFEQSDGAMTTVLAEI